MICDKNILNIPVFIFSRLVQLFLVARYHASSVVLDYFARNVLKATVLKGLAIYIYIYYLVYW